MKTRWFRLLVGLFPSSTREERGDEMLEALTELEPSATQVARESFSLIWASSVAWNRYLRSREGLWRSAYVGAVVWFVTLLAIGPMLRLRFTLRAGSSVPGSQVGPLPYVVAISFCLLAVVLMRRSRLAAALVGAVGVGAAAASNVVGPWGIVESTIYEARWLGIALALILAVGGRVKAARPLPVWLPLGYVVGASGLVMAIPLNAYQSHASRSYGMMLQWNLLPSMDDYFSGGSGQWVFVGLVVVIALAMFSHPTLAALSGASVAHLALTGRNYGVTVSLFMVLVVLAIAWRPLVDRINVKVSWRRG